MKKSKVLELVVFVCLFSTWLIGTSFEQQGYSPSNSTSFEENNPTVFQIGENSIFFEQLNEEYDGLLLTTCNNDMNQAYDVWLNLIKDIESFSKEVGVNLDGVKMWLKIYWAEDGNIDYIAFNVKPRSANIDLERLTFMLEDFRLKYEPKVLDATNKFSHYGSANYPMKAIPVYAH